MWVHVTQATAGGHYLGVLANLPLSSAFGSDELDPGDAVAYEARHIYDIEKGCKMHVVEA